MFYWIVAKPKQNRDFIMLQGAPEGQVELTMLSIIQRSKGAVFKYLGVEWVVTSCYPA